jgi:predicted Zn-dependent protease
VPASWTIAEFQLVAELAYELHLQGKDHDAAIIFEGLLALDPRNVYCLESLAALSLKLGSAAEALHYADRALQLSPNQVKALACRGEANVLLSRLKEAEDDLESMKQLSAHAQVARLGMRIANAERSSSNLLPDATLRELDR